MQAHILPLGKFMGLAMKQVSFAHNSSFCSCPLHDSTLPMLVQTIDSPGVIPHTVLLVARMRSITF